MEFITVKEEQEKVKLRMMQKAEREYDLAHDNRWMLVTESESSLMRSHAASRSHTIRLVEFTLISGLAEALKKTTLPVETQQQLIQDAQQRHRDGMDALQQQFAKFADGTEPVAEVTEAIQELPPKPAAESDPPKQEAV